MNTHQSSLIRRSAGLTKRNTGVAYLLYLFGTSLVLVVTSNMLYISVNTCRISAKYVQNYLFDESKCTYIGEIDQDRLFMTFAI